jgi:ribosome-associated protein
MTDHDTTGKKDTQKMQRAVVDALEDVKAQEIKVFDTEHLSALFERVIIASGTSNRQTKALAASVRDKVREAGFPKPRIEGEDNGEWIIVDCGAVVVHIMQPTIRQYYNLEEIWGEKPVRLKFGAPKPFAKAEVPVAKKAVAKSTRSKAGSSEPTPAPASARPPAKAPARRTAAPGGREPSRQRSDTPVFEPKPGKPTVKRSPSATKSAVAKVVIAATPKRTPAKKVIPSDKAGAPKRAPARKVPPGKA